jgi:glycosyltransferase involved in cell wall biosynthesis
MKQQNLNVQNTVFIILSFEGPDLYSAAGGLGVRVTNLSQTLSQAGFPTHLFFIGDPQKPGQEIIGDNLHLHRWCQWISEYYPHGVYEGEWDKINNFNSSIPPYIVERIALPAIQQGKTVVVMGEEWHTAEVMSLLSDALHYDGLRDRSLLFWNANNTFGFSNINWSRLQFTCRLTTVSRYMKRLMQNIGLEPLVIPNGIPAQLLEPVNDKFANDLRKILKGDSIVAKIGRWDPDKRWDTAFDAINKLKATGQKICLLARGGIEPYGEELMHYARLEGLDVQDVFTSGDTMYDYLKAIDSGANADIINIRFHCPQNLLRLIYHASDAVLANSSHEPFGLVGLETMAAGGVAVTGGTGEDYATPYYNSIVLESPDAYEVEDSILYLEDHPAEAALIRQNARNTAAHFTWQRVVQLLIGKLEFQARLQDVIGHASVSETLCNLPFQQAPAYEINS